MVYLLQQVSEALLYLRYHLNYIYMVAVLCPAAKDYTYSSGPKNAAIGPMYNNGPKKRSNMRHIAAFFALATKKPL